MSNTERTTNGDSIVANHNPALYAVVLSYTPNEGDDDPEAVYDEAACVVAWRLVEGGYLEPVTYNHSINISFSDDIPYRTYYYDVLLWDKSTGQLSSPSGESVFDSIEDAKLSCTRDGREWVTRRAASA